MSLFVCEECGCIENTALGHWWSRNEKRMWPDEKDRRALCSEHGPKKYNDGTPTKFGKWHGKFPKELARKGMVVNNPEAIRG